MPEFPVAPATLSGDVLTINRFLKSPTDVNRRLRTLSEQQFFADMILTGSVEASGGAVTYGVSESIYSDRDPQAVNAGAEYPQAISPDGAAAIARVSKYGQDLAITDEKITREKARGVDTVLRKSVNRTAWFVDTLALAAVSAAVTQTQAATAAWSSTATADPLLDVMLAQAQIDDLAQGYSADMLIVTKTLAARLVANPKVIAGVRREENTTITEDGQLSLLGGLKVLAVPAARFPAGVTAIVADSQSLGSMAYENIASPEYTGPADGIQSWVRRDPDGRDRWLIRTRRVFVPIVQEPQAAVKITGA